MQYVNILRLVCSCTLLANPVGLYAAVPCLGHEPIGAAKTFFTKHHDFYSDTPEQITGLVSERLHAALLAEYTCVQGEVCAIETDPWTNAQDGDISKPIIFNVKLLSSTKAEVSISYLLKFSEDSAVKQSTALNLASDSASGCWIITDLISPGGDSLLENIETWHATHSAETN